MNQTKLKPAALPACIALLFFMFLSVMAQPQKAGFPQPAGWVNDFENDLDLTTIAQLKKIIGAHKTKTTNQIAVVTIASYAPYKSLAEYARDLSNTWGVGEKGKNNGVTIVFSQALGEVRISIGKGLENKLTDAACQKIINDTMLPKFKEGNWDQGLLDGVTTIIKILEG